MDSVLELQRLQVFAQLMPLSLVQLGFEWKSMMENLPGECKDFMRQFELPQDLPVMVEST
jgi:hypothetical protein